MNRTLSMLLFGLFAHSILGQTNNLTGSPYSLFGLGVSSNSAIGINSSMGNGGYAISGNSLINNLNPASYGNMGERNFLFDFGFLAQISEIDNGSTTENRFAGNFSNIALASSLGPKSAFGLSVNPFSDTGYAVIGIESNIEGSFDSFSSNIFGSGALNDLRLSYGRALTDNLRAGFYASYLFGAIDEQELINASQEFQNESNLTIMESSFYRGLRLGLGFQYDVSPALTLGWSMDLAASLSARRDRTVQKNLDFVPLSVEETEDERISPFELPLALNTGVQYHPFESLGITLDYSLRLWEDTGQRDNVGVFVDEQDFSLGIQYVANANSFRYHERIKYRAGFNYNTGYLEINQNPVASYHMTAGVGFPLGLRSLSHLNISYGFQHRGSTTGILIEENIHTVNINFSLRDIWFVKRKID